MSVYDSFFLHKHKKSYISRDMFPKIEVYRGSSRSVVNNVLYCEFKSHLCYNVHFQTITRGECMNPLILQIWIK